MFSHALVTNSRPCCRFPLANTVVSAQSGVSKHSRPVAATDASVARKLQQELNGSTRESVRAHHHALLESLKFEGLRQ